LLAVVVAVKPPLAVVVALADLELRQGLRDRILQQNRCYLFNLVLRIVLLWVQVVQLTARGKIHL
jgi:hypothetical protein